MDVVVGRQQQRERGAAGGMELKLNAVERHVFAPGAMRRREAELGRLKATCLPEMAALLHQVGLFGGEGFLF